MHTRLPDRAPSPRGAGRGAARGISPILDGPWAHPSMVPVPGNAMARALCEVVSEVSSVITVGLTPPAPTISPLQTNPSVFARIPTPTPTQRQHRHSWPECQTTPGHTAPAPWAPLQSEPPAPGGWQNPGDQHPPPADVTRRPSRVCRALHSPQQGAKCGLCKHSRRRSSPTPWLLTHPTAPLPPHGSSPTPWLLSHPTLSSTPCWSTLIQGQPRLSKEALPAPCTDSMGTPQVPWSPERAGGAAAAPQARAVPTGFPHPGLCGDTASPGPPADFPGIFCCRKPAHPLAPILHIPCPQHSALRGSHWSY